MEPQQPELVLDCRNTLGEGVVWSAERRALLWVDIMKSELWSLDPAVGQSRIWKLPERAGCFAERRGGEGLVVAFASGFAFYDPQTGRRQQIAEVEAELPTTRLNDGRCDRQGRFLAGAMDESPEGRPIAGLYRLDPDLSVHRLAEGIICANSTCFSPDGRTLYFGDSWQRRIWAFDYDPATGEAGNRRVFIGFEDQPGVPDGSTVDAEGCLWNAQWNGYRVVRYDPDGRVERILELPVPNPTCVGFGGPGLDTLYITTARMTLTPEQLAAAPLSGGLFAVRPGVKGLPEPKFAG